MSQKKIPCEIYSRITGFYRPVSEFNLGKKEEFKERCGVTINTEETKFIGGEWEDIDKIT